jgi:hypothetical protein
MSNSAIDSHKSAVSILTYQQACFFFSILLIIWAGPKSIQALGNIIEVLEKLQD